MRPRISISRFVCLSVHRSISPLVHWSIGPIGPLDHWTIRPLVHWSIGPLFNCSLVECQMSKVNKVKLLSERTFGVPPVILSSDRSFLRCASTLWAATLAFSLSLCHSVTTVIQRGNYSINATQPNATTINSGQISQGSQVSSDVLNDPLLKSTILKIVMSGNFCTLVMS